MCGPHSGDYKAPIEWSAPFETLQGLWGAQNQPTHSIMEQERASNAEVKTQTERWRTEFVYRTARVVNRIHEKVDFNCEVGLKNWIINLMWWHVENRFSENNVCTWQLCCNCGCCRNSWTNFWTDSGGIGPSRPTGNPKQQYIRQFSVFFLFQIELDSAYFAYFLFTW